MGNQIEKSRKEIIKRNLLAITQIIVILGILYFASEALQNVPPEKLGNAVIFIVILVLSLLLYFLPAFIAYKRKKKNSLAILILDICLGWTFVGWVVALVWALTYEKQEKP